ncbi:MAG: hypothetical protein N3A60_13020 [Thermanaerothrix sp.]|nr:hypothetical protein [Thermanaerothrix sp.]
MKTSSRYLVRLDGLTRRLWLLVAVGLLGSCVPIYAQHPFDPRQTSEVVFEVLSHPLTASLAPLFPLFKLIPLALGIWLWFKPASARRWFSLYAGLNLLLISVLQNSANTPSYGWVILSGNILLFGSVAALWLWESGRAGSDFSIRPPWRWTWALVPLVLLAFWFPVAPGSLRPAFTPSTLMANEAGLTGCMMLPFYTWFLLAVYPAVNPVLLRMSGLVGLVIAGFNLVTFFILKPQFAWLGILHLPLTVIALLALVLSFCLPRLQFVEPATPSGRV